MNKKYVWEFTNQRKLTRKEFIDFFERKVFRTIRKYSMLPKDRIILLKKSEELNFHVLKSILEKKFIVKNSIKSNFSNENLSEISEKIFNNVLKGVFNGPRPEDEIKRPLYFCSDKEIELYAKLTAIKGKKRKKDEKIRQLIDRFIEKNQDIEINIAKALGQIRKD